MPTNKPPMLMREYYMRCCELMDRFTESQIKRWPDTVQSLQFCIDTSKRWLPEDDLEPHAHRRY